MSLKESQRLEILRSLAILDTPREERFDVIVEQSQDLFDVPICVISIIDAERTWFKACVGLPGRETDRDLSFCDISLRNGKPLVIEDATIDERVKDNPFVTEAPHMRFYAGYPLLVHEAFIGTLCLIDVVPRKFSEMDMKTLKTLSQWVIAEILRTETLALAKQVSASERRYRQMFDSSSQAIFLFSEDGAFRDCNSMARALLQLGENEAVKPSQLLAGAQERELLNAFENVRSKGNSSLEPVEVKVAENASYTLQAKFMPMLDGPDPLVMATVDDLTELVLAAETRQRLSALCGDRERELEIERANRDAFIAVLAHEIRNPLQGIVGATDILRKMGDDSLVETLGILESSCRTLSVLIDDTLDLEQIRQGKFKLKETDFHLGGFLKGVVGSFLPQAQLKNQELVWNDRGLDRCVLADQTRLRQVIGNLLSNAIKYTSAGGKIEVTAQDLSGVLHLSVKDNGIGMTKKTLKSLFEPYFQVTPEEGAQMGIGLGLAVVRSLVDLLGGVLRVESELDEGSEFTVEIPLAPGVTREEKEIQSPIHLSILVADDNPINRKILQLQLENQGARVRLAENGEEVLEHLKAEGCDIVLMDCQMPKLDGYDTTQRIRSAESVYGNPIIIALTGQSSEGERERCLAIGMNGFLRKPVRHLELFAAMKTLTAKHAVR